MGCYPTAKKDYEAGKTKLDHGPIVVNFSHDTHCNLACPSCRVDFITKAKPGTLVMHKKILGALGDARMLILSGDGDPFASPLYRKFLQDFRPEQYPSVNVISLITNGILWNKKMWDSMPAVHPYVKSACVSIDGATKDTYEENRKGAKWHVLLRNLDFISTLNLNTRINVVIQDNNFREIPLFVELAQKYDWNITFSKVLDCGTWPPDEFIRRAVWLDTHQNQAELKQIMEQYDETDKVCFGNLRSIM
jgi:MoaA/NifB/PqqE/SkfB family radical SAM enzyme